MAETLFQKGQVHFGVTPTLWSNDDFLDIDIGIPFEQIIDDMKSAGFEGCSLGHKYPSSIATLKEALRQRNLKISEPWVSTYFTINNMYDKTLSDFEKKLGFLEQMGSGDLVLAELGGSSHQQPIALMANTPRFTDEQWRRLGSGLNKLGEKAKCKNIDVCYHHHMGTGVMTAHDISCLAKCTDSNLVSFCLDTGHLLFAGGDSLDFIDKYGDRIKHVHLKNIRQDIMDKSLNEEWSFKESIEAGVFTVPGDPKGCIDFKPILKALADKGFKGWLVVEAEQNPAKANPLEYAKMARDYLREITGL